MQSPIERREKKRRKKEEKKKKLHNPGGVYIVPPFHSIALPGSTRAYYRASIKKGKRKRIVFHKRT